MVARKKAPDRWFVIKGGAMQGFPSYSEALTCFDKTNGHVFLSTLNGRAVKVKNTPEPDTHEEEE